MRVPVNYALPRCRLCLRASAVSQVGHKARPLRTGLTLEQVSFLFEGNRVRCALLFA